MKNIGILGPAGSGKGTAANFFVKKYRYKSLTMSDTLRAIAKEKKIKPTRENLHKLQGVYRKKYGTDFIIKEVLKKTKGIKKPIVLDGIRSIPDVKGAKKHLKIKLILVDAPPKIRFKRLKKRRRKGFPRTFEDFKKMEKEENRAFKFKKVFKHADYKIINSKDKNSLNKDLQKLIPKLK